MLHSLVFLVLRCYSCPCMKYFWRTSLFIIWLWGQEQTHYNFPQTFILSDFLEWQIFLCHVRCFSWPLMDVNGTMCKLSNHYYSSDSIKRWSLCTFHGCKLPKFWVRLLWVMISTKSCIFCFISASSFKTNDHLQINFCYTDVARATPFLKFLALFFYI